MADVPWRRIGAAKPVWARTAAHASNSFFVYFALAWLPSYFARTFGMTMADASAATLLPSPRAPSARSPPASCATRSSSRRSGCR